ncbi:MAG: hypothetical protein Q9184_005855 [Pyrenodesmia sp. 2 TL-2023]
MKDCERDGRAGVNARVGNDNKLGPYKATSSAWHATPYWATKIALTRLPKARMVLSMSWNGAMPDAGMTRIIPIMPTDVAMESAASHNNLLRMKTASAYWDDEQLRMNFRFIWVVK